MTRDELLSGAKPILFNTDMVRAVRRAEDPKRATRRSIRWEKVREALEIPGRKANPDIPDEKYIRGLVDAPCDKGDILYVRETWNVTPEGGYRYRADGEGTGSWKPSIHMPKGAARTFLQVGYVQAQRLQEMTLTDFIMEGVTLRPEAYNDPENAYRQAREIFREIWDGTVRKQALSRYGWDANPWVWAVEFARIYPDHWVTETPGEAAGL